MTDRLCALALLFSFDLSDNFSTEGDLGNLGPPPPPPLKYFPARTIFSYFRVAWITCSLKVSHFGKNHRLTGLHPQLQNLAFRISRKLFQDQILPRRENYQIFSRRWSGKPYFWWAWSNPSTNRYIKIKKALSPFYCKKYFW